MGKTGRLKERKKERKKEATFVNWAKCGLIGYQNLLKKLYNQIYKRKNKLVHDL